MSDEALLDGRLDVDGTPARPHVQHCWRMVWLRGLSPCLTPRGVCSLPALPTPAMNRQELQANLQARGLKTTGLRMQLVSRLKLYIEAKRESSLAYHATGGAYRMEVSRRNAGRVL